MKATSIGAGILLASLAGLAHAQASAGTASFVLVGDPQLHAMSGGFIKQSSATANAGVRVSRRYPEENLLAEFSLMSLIADATRLPGGRADDMVVLLGDGMNIGCTGEYDRLDARLGEVRGDGERVVLWAHGNHDTFMTGTINDYYPYARGQVGLPDVLDDMMDSDVPIDASWWKPPPEQPTTAAAWNNLCWDDRGSVPINKGQWIARYAKSIGATLAGAKDAEGEYRLSASVDPGSLLAARNFDLRGRWFRPLSNDYATEAAANTPYLSYIVQGIDVGDRYRMILIDTSVCRVATLLSSNAGTNPCIGEDQFRDIAAMVDATDRPLLIGAHFPIDDLTAGEQKALLAILNDGNRPWTYFSAHTHATHSAPVDRSAEMSYANAAGEPRYDFNVGSTTDWPMEAHRVLLDGSPTGVTLAKVASREADALPYARSSTEPLVPYELCRHVFVAERLAAVDPSTPAGREWRGGPRLTDNLGGCHWNMPDYAARLETARATIARKMSQAPYRQRMMMIMRGASLQSARDFSLSDLEDVVR